RPCAVIVLHRDFADLAPTLRLLTEANILVVAASNASQRLGGLDVDISAPDGDLLRTIQTACNPDTGVSSPGAQAKPSEDSSDESPETLSGSGGEQTTVHDVISVLPARSRARLRFYKEKVLHRRIQSRVEQTGLSDWNEYLHVLRRDQEEVGRLLSSFDIGVTEFFRDRQLFDWLTTEGTRRLLEASPDDIRVWVPACSTGEEAYSIAMVIFEALEHHGRTRGFRVFATDVSEAAIESARRGWYTDEAIGSLEHRRRERYFEADRGGWRAKSFLRRYLSFSVQDILKDPPLSAMDLISCRNLLIYLNSEGHRQLGAVFRFALKEHGLLILGPSEDGGRLKPFLKPINTRLQVYSRSNDTPAHYHLRNFPRPTAGTSQGRRGTRSRGQEKEAFSEVVRAALLRYASVPAIVCSHDGSIRYLNGAAGRFIRHGTGVVSTNVLDLAVPGLRVELGLALREASSTGLATVRYQLTLTHDDRTDEVDVRVVPITDPPSLAGGFVIALYADSVGCRLARERVSRSSAEDSAPTHDNPTPRERGRDSYVAALEAEVESLGRLHRQAMVDLESINDELRTRTEELESRNEELQSVNEEAESAREELTVLNEELRAANQELEKLLKERKSDDRAG
ncbi:MAG: CheR family methyltransferase, partial [Spirochaetales bacterium]